MPSHVRKSFGDMSMKQKVLVIILPCLMAVYGFGSNILSFAQAVSAYNKVESAITEVAGVMETFKSRPVSDIKLLPSGSSSCPSGYSTLEVQSDGIDLQRTLEWKGTDGMCSCGYRTSAVITSPRSEYDRCPLADQTQNPFKADPRTAVLPPIGCGITSRKRYKNCKVSGSQFKCVFKNSDMRTVKRCNRTHEEAGCVSIPPVNPKVLTKWGDNLLCIKRSAGSVAALSKVSKGKCPSGEKKCGASICVKSNEDCPLVAFQVVGSTATLIRLDEQSAKEPIVSILVASGAPCKNDNEDFDGFEPPLKTTHSAYNDEGAKAFERLNGNCDADEDWLVAGNKLHTQMLSGNGIGGAPGFEVGTVRNIAPNQDGNFNIYNREGKDGQRWKMSYRRSVPWSTNCTLSRSQVASKYEELLTLKSSQFALIFIQGFFGLFLFTIIFPALLVMQLFEKDQDLACVPGEGVEEMRNLSLCRSAVKFVSYLAKVIPLVLSFTASSSFVGFFTSATSCSSDASVKTAITLLDTRAPEIQGANRTAMALDLFGFVVLVLGVAWKAYKGFKPDESLFDEERETTDINQQGK